MRFIVFIRRVYYFSKGVPRPFLRAYRIFIYLAKMKSQRQGCARLDSTRKAGSVDLVIARYNENLDWTKSIQYDLHIYNKGGKIPGQIVKELSNIGREAHTYLHHILSNWNNLADITIFCQGDPFLHSPDFLKLLTKVNRYKSVQPLSWRWLEREELGWSDENIPEYAKDGIPPLSFRQNHKNEWIDDCRISVEYQNESMITVDPYYYEDLGVTRGLPIARRYRKQAMRMACEWIGIPFESVTMPTPFCYAAQFAVTREVIRSLGLPFYENLMKKLLLSCLTGDRAPATVLERLWLTIFGYDTSHRK